MILTSWLACLCLSRAEIAMPYNIMCVGPSQGHFFLLFYLSYLEAWLCYSQYPHAKTPDCVTPVNSRDVELR